jgi:CheY-like chemotaxis protein
VVKVLVVEDNSDARSLIKAILEQKQLEVIEAEDGIEGLERVRSESPDLIITDLSMPRMSGKEMIKRLRNSPRSKHMPILAITAYGIERAMEAIKAGANRALTRPLPNDLLLTFVFDLLRTSN